MKRFAAALLILALLPTVAGARPPIPRNGFSRWVPISRYMMIPARFR